MEIYKLPQIFIVQLKRFKGLGYNDEKNNIKIHYPVNGLDMTKYVLNKETPRSSLDCMEIEDKTIEEQSNVKINV